jgi:ribonuclease HII
MASRRQRPPDLFGDVATVDPCLDWARELGGVVAGLDEAGRGPLAGPVVAACVVLPSELPVALSALADSKALDESAREGLVPAIEASALAYAVVFAESEVIDAHNILRASLGAMADALLTCEGRLRRPIVGALIDGNQRAPLPPRVLQRPLVKGDAISRPIMAASILAKVARDRRMVREHTRYPAYGFDVHKGYPTPAHLHALAEHGPCPLHRRSFAPVKAAIAARA